MKKKLATLLAALLLIAGCAGAMAAEKTLTVGTGEAYATIQAAIDFIDTQEDKTGWTINVKAGNYERFTVLNDMHELTVKAADGAQVNIAVCSGSAAPATTSGGFPDTYGVSIRQADNVTLDGLTFNVGTTAGMWYGAAVSNYSESGTKGNNPIVTNCTFNGSGSRIGVFINTGTTKFEVTNNTFSGLSEAVSMYGDGTLMASAKVTGNTITDCSFAVHGYYGGNGNAGTMTIANNVIEGTDYLRIKIVVQDQVNSGAIKVDVKNNTMTNAIVGLVNLRESGEIVSDVLSANEFSEHCHYVEAIEPGTIEFYSAYQAPKGEYGVWALLGISFEEYESWFKSQLKADHRFLYFVEKYESDNNKFNAGFNEYYKQTDVQQAVKASYAAIDEYITSTVENANENNNGTLEFSSLNQILSITSQYLEDEKMAERSKSWELLIPTFTWFKDAIYWETLPAPTPAPTATPVPDTIDLPDTGDKSSFAFFAALLTLSAAGMLLLMRRRSAER